MQTIFPSVEVPPFSLYVLQNMTGPDQNQLNVVNPNHPNTLGRITIIDWALLDGDEENAKVIGRLQGIDIKTDSTSTFNWLINYSIIFLDERYNGSTLQVRGTWNPNKSSFELAIVGGTGQFTLAQGIIYGKVLSTIDDVRRMELDFHVFYRPFEDVKKN